MEGNVFYLKICIVTHARKTFKDFKMFFDERIELITQQFNQLATVEEGNITIEQAQEFLSDLSIIITYDCKAAKTFFIATNPDLPQNLDLQYFNQIHYQTKIFNRKLSLGDFK